MPDVPTSNPKQFYQGAPLLTVANVTATAEYYRNTLGFKTDPGGETPDYCVVWRDNAAVHLARGGQAPVGVRILFWFRDVNTLYSEVVERGVSIDVPIERVRTESGTSPFGIRMM